MDSYLTCLQFQWYLILMCPSWTYAFGCAACLLQFVWEYFGYFFKVNIQQWEWLPVYLIFLSFNYCLIFWNAQLRLFFSLSYRRNLGFSNVIPKVFKQLFSETILHPFLEVSNHQTLIFSFGNSNRIQTHKHLVC